ncbi:hypothetical protein ACQEV2_41710 [Streptomyces sp. CA-251387]|uniref:hypothetical protein n=1 Tax=Streptomyces sp. CA-251387 TaxID=3240064 RepID=UPI003D8B1E5F
MGEDGQQEQVCAVDGVLLGAVGGGGAVGHLGAVVGVAGPLVEEAGQQRGQALALGLGEAGELFAGVAHDFGPVGERDVGEQRIQPTVVDGMVAVRSGGGQQMAQLPGDEPGQKVLAEGGVQEFVGSAFVAGDDRLGFVDEEEAAEQQRRGVGRGGLQQGGQVFFGVGGGDALPVTVEHADRDDGQALQFVFHAGGFRVGRQGVVFGDLAADELGQEPLVQAQALDVLTVQLVQGVVGGVVEGEHEQQ